jgi:RNA polymerase sigma factor (TIGR02999 family)
LQERVIHDELNSSLFGGARVPTLIVATRFRPLLTGEHCVVGVRMQPESAFVLRAAPAMHPAQDVSALLIRASAGDRQCEARLFEVVYDELRRIAAAQLRRERPEHTLQRSALVNEAYLRLFGRRPVTFLNRAHFFSIAASTMRRILIDHARARNADKRQTLLNEMNAEGPAVDHDADRLLAVDAALQRLAEWDPRQAKVVELRFFAGLTVEETADALGISSKTVKRDWSLARAWLQIQIEGPSHVVG